MAKTIPQLTDATTVNAADELIIQQGGITKRATGAELAKGLNAINGTVSVKDFGAVGNGVTDDTAAIQAALDAIPASGGGIYIPQGTYKCTAPLTASNKPVSVYGCGVGISILEWSGPATVGQNGITYSNTSFEPFHIRDVSMIAYADSTSASTLCGTGIHITYPSNPTEIETTAKIERVEVRGKMIGGSGVTSHSGWTTCIYAKDAGRLRIIDCNISGYVPLNNKGIHLATGSNAFQPIIEHTEFTNFETGVYSEGPSSPGNTVVSYCNFSLCWRGITVDVPTDMVTFCNNYFQMYNHGIYCKARTVFITGNRIDGVNDPRALHSPLGLTGIIIDGTTSGPYDGGVVSGNTFDRLSAETMDGIVLDGVVQGTVVTGNTIGSTAQYGTALRNGVWLKNGAIKNFVAHNIMIAATCLVKDNTPSGSQNIVTDNMTVHGNGMMPVSGASINLASGQFNKTVSSAVYLTQTAPTTVTTIVNGFDGQVLTIIAGDANSTIQHSNTTLLLAGSTNFSMSGNDTLTLLNDGSAWREIARTT